MTNDPQTKDPTMTDEPNADLVEMLRAMRPDLEKISNERVLGLLVGWTMRVTPSEFLRILAWANARRDAAVGAAKVWRPIETAPQDGSWILGWAQSDRSPYGISWGRNHNGTLSWCTQFGSFVRGYITHWMPLPGMPVPDPLSTITAALSDTEARDG